MIGIQTLNHVNKIKILTHLLYVLEQGNIKHAIHIFKYIKIKKKNYLSSTSVSLA